MKTKADKEQISVTGKILYPIQVGAPAMIAEPDGYRRTSAVCAVISDTPKTIVIETRNSVYSIQKV